VTFQLRFHRMDRSCSHDAVIRVYDEAGNVIEMHEAARDLTQTDAGRLGRATFSPGRFRDCSPYTEKT
jgi:hypothetical protein